jgi:hypothetical protein
MSVERNQERKFMEEMEEIEVSTPAELTSEDEFETIPESMNPTVRNILIGGAVLTIIVGISALLYGLVSHPPLTAVLRDISIIVLALVTIIVGLFLAILIFQLQSLIVLLRDEIAPILDSVNETAGTVRGTTTFVSDAVVSPMIKVASYSAAVRRTIRTLTGTPKRPPRSRQDSEQT